LRWDEKAFNFPTKTDDFEDISPDLDQIEFSQYQQEFHPMLRKIWNVLNTDVKVLAKAYIDDMAMLYGYY
jgi:uncharacterized Zn finger protein